MNAVVFHEHGGPGKLQYQEMPAPTIGPNEVLIRVKACALNHLDIWIRQGQSGLSDAASAYLWFGCRRHGTNKLGRRSRGSPKGSACMCLLVSVVDTASNVWLVATICAARTG